MLLLFVGSVGRAGVMATLGAAGLGAALSGANAALVAVLIALLAALWKNPKQNQDQHE